MKSKLLFIIVCIILLFCKCDYHYIWYCDNQTNDRLYVYLALGFQTSYPDTALPNDPNKITFIAVEPYKKQMVYDTETKHEKTIKDLPKDTLSVFLIHEDTIKKYKWQEIREGYKILKRYDLGLKDLQKLDFIIPYPPTEAMKDMKMYPPYGD